MFRLEEFTADDAPRKARLATAFRGGRLKIGGPYSDPELSGADDRFFNGAEDTLLIETGGQRLECPLPISTMCSDRVVVDRRALLLLVCIPRALNHDGCITSAFQISWQRACLLVDFAASTCSQYPFVDLRRRAHDAEGASRLRFENSTPPRRHAGAPPSRSHRVWSEEQKGFN